ncbi:MAG: hypothetical protein HC845_14415 [Akkermansiaceae bacterium]|nr:hypothetical protein [Akkermansiaceae bacterium]
MSNGFLMDQGLGVTGGVVCGSGAAGITGSGDIAGVVIAPGAGSAGSVGAVTGGAGGGSISVGGLAFREARRLLALSLKPLSGNFDFASL